MDPIGTYCQTRAVWDCQGRTAFKFPARSGACQGGLSGAAVRPMAVPWSVWYLNFLHFTKEHRHSLWTSGKRNNRLVSTNPIEKRRRSTLLCSSSRSLSTRRGRRPGGPKSWRAPLGRSLFSLCFYTDQLYLDPPRGVQWTTPHYL